jgi:ribosomal protein S1
MAKNEKVNAETLENAEVAGMPKPLTEEEMDALNAAKSIPAQSEKTDDKPEAESKPKPKAKTKAKPKKEQDEPEKMPVSDVLADPPLKRKVAKEPKLIEPDAVAEFEYSNRAIISLTGHKTVQTDEEKLNEVMLELVQSLKGGQSLVGTIKGVEVYNGVVLAVLHHGPFKIIIPSYELTNNFPVYKESMGYKNELDMIFKMMENRIDSEIEYVIKGQIDKKNKLAAGSRLDAMKRRSYLRYVKPDPQGNRYMYEGADVEARVQVVTQKGIYVEIQGVETYISLEELSYQRYQDANEIYTPGDVELVRVKKIDISDPEDIKVVASAKAAKENPLVSLLPQLQKEGVYGGVVTMLTEHGVFIRLKVGADCLCKYPSFGNMPIIGSRVRVKLTSIDEDQLRLMGIIKSVQYPKGV